MTKRAICLLLVLCLLATVCSVPLSATEPETKLKNSLGRYYKFSYAAGEDQYAYELDKQVTYKGNTFYPFWKYTDKTTTASLTYKRMSDGAAGGTDVLQLKANGGVYFTPLTADGSPFEVLPGKEYVVKVNAYQEVETNHSNVFVSLGGGNKPISSWSENYANNSRSRVKGVSGDAKLENVAYGTVKDYYRPINANGFNVNGGMTWATKVYGDTTATAYKMSKTVYFGVPDENTQGCDMTPVYDAENDSYSFVWPLYNNADATSIVDSNKDGEQDTFTSNNYLTLFFSVGSFKDEQGVVHPFTYDIESIEIWENGYTPGVSFVVDGQIVKSVEGEERNNLPYFIPEAPAGKVFTGWYTDRACTQIVNDRKALSPGVTKLYAGFADKQSSIDSYLPDLRNREDKVYYPSLYASDTVNMYSGTAERGGWTYYGHTAEGYVDFHVTQPWNGSSAYLVCDPDGKAFTVDQNTTYDITVEYKVNNIISSEEVGTQPDGSTYGGGSVSFSVGAGMALKNRLNLANVKFGIRSETKAFKAETDWESQTFTITTDEMSGQLPVVGVYVFCSQLPNRFTSDGKLITSEPGNTSYGFNQLYVRRIKVTKHTQVTVLDQNGYTLSESFTRPGETFDLATLVTPGEVKLSENTGYTVSSFSYYSDAACTNKVDSTVVTAEGESMTYYAVPESPVPFDNQQVSYCGFEDDAKDIGGFTRTTGDSSATAVTASSAATVNVASGKLDDGRTYQVTMRCRSTAGASLTVGKTAVQIPAGDFRTVSVAADSVDAAMPVTLTDGDITLDNVSINTVVTSGGVSVLTDEAQEEIGGQALRAYFKYQSADGTHLTVAGQELTIVERGILLIDTEILYGELKLNTLGAVHIKKTADFDTCWDVAEGMVTYSGYIKDFEIDDTRSLGVRGYLKTDDGAVYYAEAGTHTIKEEKIFEKFLASETTYSLADPEVLNKVKIEGAYDVLPTGITFDWTGSSLIFDAVCKGEVVVEMQYSSNSIYQGYALYVDGKRSNDYLFPKETEINGRNVMALTFDVGKPGRHHVQISRRLEAAEGPSDMISLTMKGIFEETKDNDKLIEFIGDSITCGLGNLATGSSYTADKSDGTQAYAFRTAMALGTDWRIRSRSGIGFEFNSGGGHSKKGSWDLAYDYENVFRDEDLAYTQDREADLVCIYLGTNDFFNGYSNNGINVHDEADRVVQDMKDLVNIIKGYNPNAKFIWITGGMTTAYASHCQRAMKELGDEAGGYYFCKLPGGLNAGGNGHPTAEQHKALQEKLCEFIQDKGILE